MAFSGFVKKKYRELSGRPEPSWPSQKPATVPKYGLGSVCLLRGPSQARGEPKKTRAELKARPVRPALVAVQESGRGLEEDGVESWDMRNNGLWWLNIIER
jgi:hypothetical protein